MAASFSVNFPLAMISSKSSPPLQILHVSQIGVKGLLSDNVVPLFVLKELVHFHNVGMVLNSRLILSSKRALIKDTPSALEIIK